MHRTHKSADIDIFVTSKAMKMENWCWFQCSEPSDAWFCFKKLKTHVKINLINLKFENNFGESRKAARTFGPTAQNNKTRLMIVNKKKIRAKNEKKTKFKLKKETFSRFLGISRRSKNAHRYAFKLF